MGVEATAIIRITGTFDAAVAAHACSLARRLHHNGASSVVLEFAHEQDTTYVGLAALVEGLADGALPLRLRGLATHHLKTLHDVGFRLDGGEAVSPGAPRDAGAGSMAGATSDRPPSGVAVVPAPAAGGRVLLVEDDAELRSVVAEVLAGEGYDLLEAESGEEALQLLRDREPRPDLILLDLGIQLPDGRAFAQAHGEVPELSSIPLIVLTSAGADESAAENAIEKPFGRSELVAAVARTLATRAPPEIHAAVASATDHPPERCGWCGRVRTLDDAWHEADDAAASALERERGPISHGICPACAARYFPTG